MKAIILLVAATLLLLTVIGVRCGSTLAQSPQTTVQLKLKYSSICRSQEDLLAGKYGRIRDVAEGPDGFIYFSTSNKDGRGTAASDDDRIIRLVPVK